MRNKACKSCKQPMNGGVFRKPNQCPHCGAIQNTKLSADGKRPAVAGELDTVVSFSSKTQTHRPAAASAITQQKAQQKRQTAAAATKVVPLQQSQRVSPSPKKSPGAESPVTEKRPAQAKPRAAAAKKISGDKPRASAAKKVNRDKPRAAAAKKIVKPNQNVKGGSSALIKHHQSEQYKKSKARAGVALAAINKVVQAEKQRDLTD